MRRSTRPLAPGRNGTASASSFTRWRSPTASEPSLRTTRHQGRPGTSTLASTWPASRGAAGHTSPYVLTNPSGIFETVTRIRSEGDCVSTPKHDAGQMERSGQNLDHSSKSMPEPQRRSARRASRSRRASAGWCRHGAGVDSTACGVRILGNVTLILSIVAPRGIWQCTDYRLTMMQGGHVVGVTDWSPKHVTHLCPDGACSMAYTGQASAR
jgi:hypothetical protein